MKTITTITFIFLSTLFAFGQVTEIEKKIGNTGLKQIKRNACVDYNFVKETEGKIVIIEFWETWCGPCIEGMVHLKALQNKFPNSLRIVCVSSDGFDKTVEFISKNDFPFDFIYDSEKSLSKLFPHSGIPHTILIDNKGQIKAETYPGFVTEEVLNKLDGSNQINVPTKKNFVPAELEKVQNKNSLIKFELQRHELGERNCVEETCKTNIPVKIVTGYTGKAYYDTLETIKECVIAGKNALQIYQYAYDYMPMSRFVYDKNLNYLNSTLPNHLYKMSYACSNLAGDFKSTLINQLNSFWGLNTKIVEKEMTYYELVRIDEKADTIVTATNSTTNTTGRILQSYKELKASRICTAESIAALIEQQIAYIQSSKYPGQQYKEINFPVTTSITGKYALNISINDESSSVDIWVELLAKNGLHLVKKKGKIKHVKIERIAIEN